MPGARNQPLQAPAGNRHLCDPPPLCSSLKVCHYCITFNTLLEKKTHTHTPTRAHAHPKGTVAKIYTIDRRVRSHYIYVQRL